MVERPKQQERFERLYDQLVKLDESRVQEELKVLIGDGFRVDSLRKGTTNALILACEAGNWNLVKALLATNPELIWKSGKAERKSLHAAVDGGDPAVLELLLASRWTVHDMQTALHQAIKDSKVDLAVQLVEKGACAFGKDQKGLYLAERSWKKADLMSLLKTLPLKDLDSGPAKEALMSILEDGEVFEKDMYLAKLLAAATTEDDSIILLRKDLYGNNVLHQAAVYGDLQILESLLKKLGEKRAAEFVNAANQHGHTPLHYALFKRNTAVAFRLLDVKADIGKRDKKGAGPLHYAAMGGGKQFLEFIKQQGFSVNEATSVAGFTPLHYAAWNGNKEAVDWLLEGGADVSAKDNVEHAMAWQWAAMGGRRECMTALVKHGHVKQKKGLFQQEMEKCYKPLERIEDHGNPELIDLACSSVLESLKEDQGLHKQLLQSGLVECVAAYGNRLSNRQLALIVEGEERALEESRFLYWAAWGARDTELGRNRKTAIEPVAKLMRNKGSKYYSQVELAFRSTFDNPQDEDNMKWEFAVQLGKYFSHMVPMLIRNVVHNRDAGLLFSIQRKKLPPEERHDFPDDQSLMQVMPAAYWVARLGTEVSSKKEDSKLTEKIHKFAESVLKGYPNDRGMYRGRTALHWATMFEEADTVFALCDTYHCKADIPDDLGKAPYWYTTRLLEEQGTLNYLKWDNYQESLHKDRQLYVDGMNAVLVGAALIASVTFGSFLNPPLGYSWNVGTTNYVSVNKVGIRAFTVCNSLSFFFAMASALAGVTGILPAHDKFTLQEVRRLHWMLVVAAILLVLSISAVLLAFATAGMSVVPPSFRYQKSIIWPLVAAGVFCIRMLFGFTMRLLPLLLPLRHTLPSLLLYRCNMAFKRRPLDMPLSEKSKSEKFKSEESKKSEEESKPVQSKKSEESKSENFKSDGSKKSEESKSEESKKEKPVQSKKSEESKSENFKSDGSKKSEESKSEKFKQLPGPGGKYTSFWLGEVVGESTSSPSSREGTMEGASLLEESPCLEVASPLAHVALTVTEV